MVKRFYSLTFLLLLIFFLRCSENAQINPPGNNLQQTSEIDLSNFLSEPSGIVYSSKSNSLFVVSDALNKIFKLDLSGNLINSIDVSGNDFEGIGLSLSKDTILVVEESDNQVTTFTLTGNKIKSFTKNVATLSGNGLEGITVDNFGYIYIINEKAPRYLIKMLNEVEVSRTEISVVNDLSDICYDVSLDCLWIISDESKKIIKISKDGTLISEWNLPFDKGEGITFVQDKMYIVNDDNSKLYIFNKP
jgi:uncharacterized protein YjiK